MLHKLQKLVVAVGTVAMLFGTMGAVGASASTTATVLTRAQFVYDFAVANNLAPVYPSTPTFKDVPASSPYYGYIEAAYEAGWIIGVGNGDFAPTSPLTRAQVVKIEVIALGDGPAALTYMNTATTFTDDSTIPSWARGYVVEGVKLGLIKGYPNGTFAPNQSLTTADEPYFLAQYKAAETATAFTIAGSPSDAAVGQAVTLSATGTTETVTYSVSSSNAAINGDTFIASAAGNYTVTGTSSGGATATTVVHVYGAATGLKINAPATIVANNASANTVTVDVVDANGNIVASNSNSITLTSSNTGVGSVATSPETASNGVATFTLNSGTVVGGTTTLTANDSTLSVSQTATVTSVAQKATSITVTAASPTVENNDGSGSDTFTAVVNDQTGNPMISGTYEINWTVSGAGTFSGGATTTTSSYIGGSTSQTDATASVKVAQSATGAINVTASTPTAGVASGSASATAVTVGATTALTLTQSATTATADAAYAAKGTGTSSNNIDVLTIQAVDSHGYAIPSSQSGQAESVKVTEMLGSSSSSNLVMTATGATFNSTTGTLTGPLSGGTLTVYVTGSSTQADNVAGTYTFQVTDNGSLGLTASSTVSFKLTPGTATAVFVSSPTATTYVGASHPSAVVTAQIEDAEGNNVSQSGVGLVFALVPVTGTSSEASLSATSVTTNASGTASTTLTLQIYTGNSYKVSVAGASGSGISTTAVDSPAITLESTVPATLQVLLQATSNGGSQVTASSSGNTVTLTVYGEDSNGVKTGGDQVTITPSAGLVFSSATATTGTITSTYSSSTGTLTATLTNGVLVIDNIYATTSGTQTASVVDNSSTSSLSGTGSISVVAGTFSSYLVLNGSGDNLANNSTSSNDYTSFTKGTPTEVFVQPSDANGNLAPNSTAETVYLSSSAPSYVFQSSASGGILPSVTVSNIVYYELTFSAGQGTQAVYYNETSTNSTSPYDNLSATDVAP